MLRRTEPCKGREGIRRTRRGLQTARRQHSARKEAIPCLLRCSAKYLPRQLGPERFRAPEILFNPELIGQEYAGVHQVIVDSINKADLDLRKSLFSNVILSGGSTLTKGTSFAGLAKASGLMYLSCRLRRSPTQRDQEASAQRDQDQDLCTTGAQILDLDR